MQTRALPNAPAKMLMARNEPTNIARPVGSGVVVGLLEIEILALTLVELFMMRLKHRSLGDKGRPVSCLPSLWIEIRVDKMLFKSTH